MAAVASSSQTDVVMRDFVMVKYDNVLEKDDVSMSDALEYTKRVNAPRWLSDAYGRISNDIRHLGEALVQLKNEQQDPNVVAPRLVQAYNVMLQQQNALFDQQADALRNAQRHDFRRLEAASTQFASEISMAVQYAQLKAEDKISEQGKEMLRHMNDLAKHNAKQFHMVEEWAKHEEGERVKLAEEQARQKEEQKGQRKEMAKMLEWGKSWQKSMKEYKEVFDKERKKNQERDRERGKELRKIQAKALRLEAEAKALKGIKKVREEEVKKLRKLAKATATSARAASHHPEDNDLDLDDAPDEAPEPPQPPPPPPPPPPSDDDDDDDDDGPPSPPGPPDLVPLPPPPPPPSDPDSSSDASVPSLPSSDDDESEGETIASLLRARKANKKAKEEKRIETLEDLALVVRGVREKRLQIPKPEQFEGTLNCSPSYLHWYETVTDYLHHNKGTWDDDRSLIRVVASFMKGRAKEWYHTRARNLRKNHKVDTFRAFAAAMDQRFKVDFEAEAAYSKMAGVKYTSDILEYIDTLEALNEKAGVSGIHWRKTLLRGLSEKFRLNIATMRGGIPKDDDDLIAAIKEVGLVLEEHQREEKASGGNSGNTGGGQGGKNKRKRGQGQGQGTDAQEKKDEGPAAKKPKGNTSTPAAGKGTPRFTQEQKEEALKGVPENLRVARSKKSLCERCGFDNHQWKWCRKDVVISSTRKKGKGKGKGKETAEEKKETAPAASSISLKRKAPAHTVSVTIQPLSCEQRILADLRRKAGEPSKKPRASSGFKAEDSNQRIWELDSDDEKNM